MKGSLHTELLRRHPDLVVTEASKATLVVTSHLIEELAATTPGRHLLVSGFQHGRNWTVERDRYLQLDGRTDVIAVFAGEEPPAAWETDHLGVRLRAGHGLAQEWFVLALGPKLAVTLCGLDAEQPRDGTNRPVASPLEEGDRLFETVWSVDVDVARSAMDIVLTAIADSAPARAQEARERLERAAQIEPDARAVARASDCLVAGMLTRVEQTRRREKLADRRASMAKTAFLSRMGHELRNPLNAILGYAQLLELSAGAADDPAGQIGRAGEHLLELVDEVLDVSQVESGALRVDLQELDVAAIVARTLEMIRTEADVRGVEMDTRRAQTSVLRVHADQQLTVEILLNLISNAVKFNDRGGKVTLEATSDGASCRIAVTDTGPGIPAEDLERIFEAFERLPATAERAAGTGLGLALSKAMAAAMHGRIEVVSHLRQGSTFTLVLPLASA